MNLNTFLLSVIKFGQEDNRSYKEKTKRWVINNRVQNYYFLSELLIKYMQRQTESELF